MKWWCKKCHSEEAFFQEIGQPNLWITVGNYTNWVSDEWGPSLMAHVQARGTQFKSYYDSRRGAGRFHGGDHHQSKWQKWAAVVSLKQAGGKCWSPAKTRLRVRTDIRSCNWNNTPKTAKADMFCQNKEDVGASLNFLPILIYSLNDQKFTKTDLSNGFSLYVALSRSVDSSIVCSIMQKF